jgi:hypothetical protein
MKEVGEPEGQMEDAFFPEKMRQEHKELHIVGDGCRERDAENAGVKHIDADQIAGDIYDAQNNRRNGQCGS